MTRVHHWSHRLLVVAEQEAKQTLFIGILSRSESSYNKATSRPSHLIYAEFQTQNEQLDFEAEFVRAAWAVDGIYGLNTSSTHGREWHRADVAWKRMGT